jgi:hypothetical protein
VLADENGLAITKIIPLNNAQKDQTTRFDQAKVKIIQGERLTTITVTFY